MISSHSIDNLKEFHKQATQFFGSELILLKDTLPKISEDRLAKASVLLISCGQTGTALLQLANQINLFTTESVMLARAFMEKIINFCYVGVCDDNEYRAFMLHPIYKYYHILGSPKMEDDFNHITKNLAERKEKQKRLIKIPIVTEALTVFSATKTNMNWTRTNLNQRIDIIKKHGKLLDVFFTISKLQYYSDASEALHGSLYGSTFDVGAFDPEFDHTKQEIEKLYKDSTCILLHLGMLIHESFTLISYSNEIQDIWKYSYNNRRNALKLLFQVLEIKPKIKVL